MGNGTINRHVKIAALNLWEQGHLHLDDILSSLGFSRSKFNGLQSLGMPFFSHCDFVSSFWCFGGFCPPTRSRPPSQQSTSLPSSTSVYAPSSSSPLSVPCVRRLLGRLRSAFGAHRLHQRRFPTSFFDGTGLVARAGFSNPCSPHPAAWLADTVQSLKAEGRAVKPRTKKTLGGDDLIGMTALPEAKLTRDVEIRRIFVPNPFAHIATSTNYDAWRPHEACVTAAEAHKNAALASVLPEYFKVP
ncbi:hypothetical protein B0H13DRAFT_2657671 [Mycena leptocephala]|nr:hypothetical protein B0H13DRAFT_2657671 [Mycena leptocephala]